MFNNIFIHLISVSNFTLNQVNNQIFRIIPYMLFESILYLCKKHQRNLFTLQL